MDAEGLVLVWPRGNTSRDGASLRPPCRVRRINETSRGAMRKLASIQTVNAVEPIPNADAIEKVRVLGWWVVSRKGEHGPGDRLVYCEIDSLLPERPEFEFLRASSFKPAREDIPAGF